MKNLSTRLLPGLLALALCAGMATAKPLPHDPRILSGTLTNGVKWMYRQHDNPPGKMALMIHVRSGSLNEPTPSAGWPISSSTWLLTARSISPLAS